MATEFIPRRVEAPLLETERLRLRGHRPDDFADSAAMWADPLVTRYIGGKPLSEEDVWARILRYLGHWAWLGFGYWVVEDKSTGKFAGEMGFSDWKREIVPSLKGVPEIGWVLATQVHGRGYATEAVRAALAWGDANILSAQPSLGRTVCIIHPEHAKSIRVAEKCGFKQVQSTMYKGEPTILFTR
ncbi:MAG TPA: GNAT family N-acetyltransferase [Candidatus Acidoferrum sp.]|nr:GNAT family N-acetyltransferase [Candidatus Acidoferrum sp.]